MPVDERTFAAEIAGWVTEYLNTRPDLPFSRAAVEEHVTGSTSRHDFRLYRSHTNQPVLTGEVKMPDSPQGNHPLNAELVEDALLKAAQTGVRYCFTWNVRQFVLFDSHMQGVPFAHRHIEGPLDVIEASVSDDVRQEWARDAIRDYWTHFLERFAALVNGRRLFEPSPIDQRFVGWLEGALEDPIAHTEDTLTALVRRDSEFNSRLSSWMLLQNWEPSLQEEQRKAELQTSRPAIVLHPADQAGLSTRSCDDVSGKCRRSHSRGSTRPSSSAMSSTPGWAKPSNTPAITRPSSCQTRAISATSCRSCRQRRLGTGAASSTV